MMKAKLLLIRGWRMTVVLPLVVMLLSLMFCFFAVKVIIWTFHLEDYFGPL